MTLNVVDTRTDVPIRYRNSRWLEPDLFERAREVTALDLAARWSIRTSSTSTTTPTMISAHTTDASVISLPWSVDWKPILEEAEVSAVDELFQEWNGSLSILYVRRRVTQPDRSRWMLDTLKTKDAASAERLAKLSELLPDWDGYGGDPPTEHAVDTAALVVLATLGLAHGKLEPPFIAPLPDGGLELEWELVNGAELMIVIPSAESEIEYLLDEPTVSGGVIESEGKLPNDIGLSELIRRFTR